MGWDIEFYDNGLKIDHVNGVTNLTYNYSWWTECHEYWQPRRDYDGKTVGEAIAIMEQAVSKMIEDGINVIDRYEWMVANPSKPFQVSHLEDMILWLVENYAALIRIPRHWLIKLV